MLFGDMTADMESNKKLRLIVTELFLRGRKNQPLLVFITQSFSKYQNYKTKCNTFIAKILKKGTLTSSIK